MIPQNLQNMPYIFPICNKNIQKKNSKRPTDRPTKPPPSRSMSLASPHRSGGRAAEPPPGCVPSRSLGCGALDKSFLENLSKIENWWITSLLRKKLALEHCLRTKTTQKLKKCFKPNWRSAWPWVALPYLVRPVPWPADRKRLAEAPAVFLGGGWRGFGENLMGVDFAPPGFYPKFQNAGKLMSRNATSTSSTEWVGQSLNGFRSSEVAGSQEIHPKLFNFSHHYSKSISTILRIVFEIFSNNIRPNIFNFRTKNVWKNCFLNVFWNIWQMFERWWTVT